MNGTQAKVCLSVAIFKYKVALLDRVTQTVQTRLRSDRDYNTTIGSKSYSCYHRFNNFGVIFCNNRLVPNKCGVTETCFSDHFTTYAVFPAEIDPNTPQIIRKRNYKHFVYEEFIKDLHDSDILKTYLCSRTFSLHGTF